MSQIAVDNVRKVFDTRMEQVVALEETSLEVSSEQIVSIVGPSGCGKTTLLDLIAGFTLPSTGTISVDGEPVTGPGADRAVVFQEDAVFPWLTVKDNMSYGLRMRGVPKSQSSERVERFLSIVSLQDFGNSYPHELSGGMRKRVDLARAYVNDPKILVLDEPFGALDVFTKESMQVSLLEIAVEEPKTIIFVTHDIEEAIYMGDRVIVMSPRPGRVSADIEVSFERTPSLEMRASSEFQNLRLKISSLLRDGE